jgi:hypothetical protein
MIGPGKIPSANTALQGVEIQKKKKQEKQKQKLTSEQIHQERSEY